MARNDIENTTSTIEDQIAELRSRIEELSSSLSERAGSAAEEAGEFIDSARGKARQVVHQVKAQGSQVVDTVRDNPGTATSVLLAVGAIGLTIGYLISSTSQPSRNEFWRR